MRVSVLRLAFRRAAMRRHLMEALNLTDAQKQQAKTIFQEARQSAQPLRQELRQNRQALAVAVKANDTAKIQQLSQTEGNLLARKGDRHPHRSHCEVLRDPDARTARQS